MPGTYRHSGSVMPVVPCSRSHSEVIEVTGDVFSEHRSAALAQMLPTVPRVLTSRLSLSISSRQPIFPHALPLFLVWPGRSVFLDDSGPLHDGGFAHPGKSLVPPAEPQPLVAGFAPQEGCEVPSLCALPAHPSTWWDLSECCGLSPAKLTLMSGPDAAVLELGLMGGARVPGWSLTNGLTAFLHGWVLPLKDPIVMVGVVQS